MTTRRSFLGSLLGIVAGAPFYAKAATEPPVKIPEAPIKYPYHFTLVDLETKTIIHAPPIEKIYLQDNIWNFQAYPMTIHRALNFESLQLWNGNEFIKEKKFDRGHTHVINGDTLNLIYGCNMHNLDGSKFTIEEVVSLAKRMKDA